MAVNLRVTRAASTVMNVVNLHCEYGANPLGIDVPEPRLSWALTSSRREEKQSAYQILVASSQDKLIAGDGNLWDSGKVASDQSTQIPYQGKQLASRQRYYWKVRAWDKDGEPSGFSDMATWEMGLLSPKDWKGCWIGFTPGWNDRALYFRYDLDLKKRVKEGRAYVVGLGYYELRMNGVRVGDQVLDPAWTDYSKRVLYSTYDVGKLLQEGSNVVGVIVGEWLVRHAQTSSPD